MRIYLFPFLIDFVLFLVMLRVSDAAGREMHLSNLQIALFVIAYSLAYLVACPLAGRVLGRRDARPILILAVTALLVCGVPVFFTRTFYPTLWLMVALGVIVAFAFNSLQSFLRGESKHGALSRTIAKYTLSWSLGIACGFMLGGVLKDTGGAVALAGCSVLACAGILLMVFTHPSKHEEFVSADGAIENPAGTGPHIDSRYVAVGWMLCVSANFGQRPLTTFIPKLAAEHGKAPWVAGTLLFALYVCQALGGFGSRRWRHLLYRRGPLVGAQVLIAFLMMLLWISPGFVYSLAFMLMLGLAYGFIYFSCVYYVSNDVNSARSVGINEAMVGVGTVFGVSVSEAIMRYADNPVAFYPVTIVATLALAGLQWLWLNARAPGPSAADLISNDAGSLTD